MIPILKISYWLWLVHVWDYFFIKTFARHYNVVQYFGEKNRTQTHILANEGHKTLLFWESVQNLFPWVSPIAVRWTARTSDLGNVAPCGSWTSQFFKLCLADLANHFVSVELFFLFVRYEPEDVPEHTVAFLKPALNSPIRWFKKKIAFNCFFISLFCI